MSAGEAATVVGRLYERWRSAVEDVEAAVRVNRRAAHRAGTTRGESPIHAAARRTWEQMAAGIRLFPRDMLKPTDEFETLSSRGKIQFAEQTPLFSPGQVDLGEGSIVDLGSWDRVLYLQMLVSVGYQSPYLVPLDGNRAASIVRAFEKEREAVHDQARDAARVFVASRDLDQVVYAAERLWMRACRAAGMSDRRTPRADAVDRLN